MLLFPILWLFFIHGNDGQINQIEFTILMNSCFTPVSDALIVQQKRMATSDSALVDCARSCVEIGNRCDIVVYSAKDRMCRIYVNTGGFQQFSSGSTTFVRGDPSVASPVNLPRTSQWVTASSMSAARKSHTATLLSSGQVLVAGGGNETFVHASCELYDPDSDTWSTIGSMATPRAMHTATRLMINDTELIFVLGGSSTTAFNPVPTIEYYNVTNGVWRTIANPMRQGRLAHTTTLLMNGRLLTAGGQTDTSRIGITEIFDPITLTSQLVDSLNIARYTHAASIIGINGNVLVISGIDPTSTIVRSCELFDMNSSSWSLAVDMSNERNLASLQSAFPASPSLLIVGGQTGNYSSSSSELYDPLTNTLSPSGSMTIGRYSHSSTLIYYQSTALVVIIGGYDTALNGTSSAELYVIANSTWLSIAGMHTGRGLHRATLLVGSPPSILVSGGETSRPGTTLRSVERLILT